MYWCGMMVMACAMFPILGDTPPPWRWRNDVIVTSAVQHLVYAATTTAILSALARRDRWPGTVPADEPALEATEEAA